MGTTQQGDMCNLPYDSDVLLMNESGSMKAFLYFMCMYNQYKTTL